MCYCDLATRANWDVLNNTIGSDHSSTVVALDEVGEIDHASGDRSFPKFSKTNFSHQAENWMLLFEMFSVT